MDKKKKSVLIIGGGVAAFAAAHALVEWNKATEKNEKVDFLFQIHIVTRDDIWGGRASSWPGGRKRPHGKGKEEWNFRYWPPQFQLNHGFHAVWSKTTYANFMHMLEDVWKRTAPALPSLVGEILISNRRELLVYENERICSLKIHGPNKYSWPLNSHLVDATTELVTRGGWSPLEVKSFKDVIMNEVLKYPDFDKLAAWDKYQAIEFEKWCRDRCIRESLFNKGIYKFIFDGTYVAPFKMDATSGLMALWILLRNCDAAEWFYINGGITQRIHEPIKRYLESEGNVKFHEKIELDRFTCEKATNKLTEAYFREPLFKEHFFGESGKNETYKCKALEAQARTFLQPEKLQEEGFQVDDKNTSEFGGGTPVDFAYYISTIPLDNFYEVLCLSDMIHLPCFQNVNNLRNSKFFTQPVGTVNLQAWFKKPNLIGSHKNVIAGLEPLCIAIDYKNILPMYKDNKEYGSVLEINGSLKELADPEFSGYWELGDAKQNVFLTPEEPQTIDFAKRILIDFARRYNFEKLEEAVENEEFLELPDDVAEWPKREKWKDTSKIPPFLWKNTDPYNRFFVTGPGTLQQRPWIWNKGYPTNLFLAGDWTRNGFDLPSMEGAARSGRMAARAVLLRAWGQDPDIDPRDPEPEDANYAKNDKNKQNRHRVPEGTEGIQIYSPDQKED
jgi:uncharacterized protein with NAD-binding domain and iron-sulfur cluster